MSKKKNSYWKDIKDSVGTLSEGLKLTLKHIGESTETIKNKDVSDQNYFDGDKGIFTVQYPKESIPVPDNGRYRLHNEIDDCIVCDKCVKVCPVNCIEIEPIKAVDDMGSTSDGTKKRIHAAKFDIDMGKCCFCGLCTTVCPTECLTMTKSYDFSVFDIKEHNYSFSKMTEEDITREQKKLDDFQKEKEKQLEAKKSEIKIPETASKPKPTFKPKLKPKTTSETKEGSEQKEVSKKPVFRPKVKPVAKPKPNTPVEGQASEEKPEEPVKPKFRPKIKPKKKDD